MVNNNNLNNLINNKKPVELVQEIEKYEIKKSPLSPAARGKVINKSGSDYVSENKEGYGPGFKEYEKMENSLWEESFRKEREKNRKSLCLRDGCWKRRRCGDDEYCSEHCEEYEDKVRFTKWMGKTALGIGTGALLGPFGSFVAGGTLWGANKATEAITGEKNEVIGAIGDFGSSLATGSIFSSLGGAIAGSIAESHALVGEQWEAFSKWHNLGEKLTDAGFTASDIARHDYHKRQGRSYDSDCPICKAW